MSRPFHRGPRVAALVAMLAAVCSGEAMAQTPVFTLSSPDLASGSFSTRFILNAFGCTGGNGNYAGPCPPTGDTPHRYRFTLYAYGVPDVQAAGGIPRTGTAGLYSFILNKGIGSQLLGKASFTATYAR